MRLTCPNCAAQYEVPPEAIPPQGRDVQCSACGQTWFEQPADSRPRRMDALEEGGRRVEDDPEEADDLAEIEASPAPAPVVAPAARVAAPAAAPAASAAVPPAAAATVPPAAEAAERQRVPPEVERILREEAQHEARVRAEEAARRAAAAEPVPVPVIERPAGAPPRSEVIEAAAMTPAEEPAPVIRTIRPARHVDRELDLDRINSTLRSHADKIGAPAPRVEATARRRGDAGFGGGFWGALLAIAILALIYVYRGQIIQVVPPAAAVLNPYAEAVETGRNWLDRQVARVLGADAPEE